MWTCQSCQTQNPKASSFCQTCGERPSLVNGIHKPKTSHHPVSSNQEAKRKGLESYYYQAQHRFAESDFSLIVLLGTYAIIMSLLTVLGGIIFMFILWSDGEFLMGIVQFVLSILIAIPGFIFHNFIEYLLEIKEEVNQTRQEMYVANQMNDRMLETLEKILVAVDKGNSNQIKL